MFGLDDLRQWTIGGSIHRIQPHVDIYLDQSTMNVVSISFPYLVDKSMATGGGDVPSLKFHVFDLDGLKPFLIDGLEVIPFQGMKSSTQ